MFIISQNVCLCKPFQLSLLFASKTRIYTCEVPFRCSTLRQAPGPTLKHYTMLYRPSRGKHSRILLAFVNCGRKKFYNIGNLRIFLFVLFDKCYKTFLTNFCFLRYYPRLIFEGRLFHSFCSSLTSKFDLQTPQLIAQMCNSRSI